MTIYANLRPETNATEFCISAQPSFTDPLDGYEQYATEGWDGEGAAAITADTLVAARDFLGRLPSGIPTPFVAPASDGTIGLEWRDVGSIKKLFVDIGPGSVATAYWRSADRSRQDIPTGSPGVLCHTLTIQVFPQMDCGPL